jgi:hypothetical protein
MTGPSTGHTHDPNDRAGAIAALDGSTEDDHDPVRSTISRGRTNVCSATPALR